MVTILAFLFLWKSVQNLLENCILSDAKENRIPLKDNLFWLSFLHPWRGQLGQWAYNARDSQATESEAEIYQVQVVP
jgi:hypothetical protein